MPRDPRLSNNLIDPRSLATGASFVYIGSRAHGEGGDEDATDMTNPMGTDQLVGATSSAEAMIQTKYATHASGAPRATDSTVLTEQMESISMGLDEVLSKVSQRIMADWNAQLRGAAPRYYRVCFTQRQEGDQAIIVYADRCVIPPELTLKSSMSFYSMPIEATPLAAVHTYRLDAASTRPTTKQEEDLLVGPSAVLSGPIYPRSAGTARIRTPRLIAPDFVPGRPIPSASGTYTGLYDGAFSLRVYSTNSGVWFAPPKLKLAAAESLTLNVNGSSVTVNMGAGTHTQLDLVNLINAASPGLASLLPDLSIRLSATGLLRVTAVPASLSSYLRVSGGYQVICSPGPYELTAAATITVDGTPISLPVATYTAASAATAINTAAGSPVAHVWQNRLVLTSPLAPGGSVSLTNAELGAAGNSFLPRFDLSGPNSHTATTDLIWVADSGVIGSGVSVTVPDGLLPGERIVVGVVSAEAQTNAPRIPFPYLDEVDLLGAVDDQTTEIKSKAVDLSSGTPLRKVYTRSGEVSAKVTVALRELNQEALLRAEDGEAYFETSIEVVYQGPDGKMLSVILPLAQITWDSRTYSQEINDFAKIVVTYAGKQTAQTPVAALVVGGLLC